MIHLKKKKQTILFLNRRGYSSFVICRDCGYTAKCKNFKDMFANTENITVLVNSTISDNMIKEIEEYTIIQYIDQ